MVVVGNGPVGHRFVRRSLELAGGGRQCLVVFGEEHRPAYDRVRLTSGFTEGQYDFLELAPREWYEEFGVELHTGDPVVKIDLKGRRVVSRSGLEVHYDELVLATGSSAFVPPVDGIDLPGVFPYRTLDDLDAIRSHADGAERAVVLGGGLLGLEAARALLDHGLETHVVEMAPVLMARQLDSEGATLLQRFVEDLGVHVHLLRRLQRVVGDSHVHGLEFENDCLIGVDMVVVAAGIRPRDELARRADLEVGPRGGIVVNDGLQTSDRHVYAIGECALHRGTIYGLAAPGYRMADVLARRLAGEKATFEGSDESTKLKLMGVDVSLSGEYLDPTGCEILVHETESTYRKVMLRRRRLVGAMAVGPFEELSRVQESIATSRRIRLGDRRRFVREGTLWEDPEGVDVATWPDDTIVCACKGITRGALSLAHEAGCETVEALAARTQASTVCGSCRPLLAALTGGWAPPSNVPWRTLLAVSILGGLACLPFVFGPIPYATSIQSRLYAVEALWRDSFWKQVTGFTMLGLTAAALLISLRKRVRWLSWGSLPVWRILHATIGVSTLVLLAAHTGLHLGANLNLALMLAFLAVNALGVLSGVLAALESGRNERRAMLARRWRPRLVLLHTFAFWPFPILVAFHIAAFYYL